MFDLGAAIGPTEEQNLAKDVDFGKLFLVAWEKTRLVPCFWRTVFASDLMARPVSYKYHLTCPACYEKVSFLDDVTALDDLSVTTTSYWLGSVLFDGKVYPVLFTRFQANKLYTIAQERNLIGKSFCFTIEEDIEGRLVPVFHKSKLVPKDVISARPVLRFEKNFIHWLRGELPTLKSFKAYGPFQLFWMEANNFRYYFVPYYFHRLEECPSTGIMVLSKLYQQHGLLNFDRIIQAISKE